jgi:hypothetical protein
MDVEVSANDGISFQNVQLESRIMVAEMNVPYLSLRTFSTIDSAVRTGQIYVRVRRGDDAYVTSGKYRLLIFQR